jgi:hypothetical protein
MVVIITLLYGLICFAIGEFFGRAKHIGRWWTMFLFWSAPIPLIGLLALLLSPSAKGFHEVRDKTLFTILGVVFFFLALGSLGSVFSSYNVLRHFGWIFLIASFTHGLYFVNLGLGNVRNENPKFYFSVKTSSDNSETKRKYQNQQNLEELLQKGQITEDEYILFKKRQEEIEEKNREKERQQKIKDDNRRALKQLKSLRESGILTEDEYRDKVAKLSQIDKKNGTSEGGAGGDEYSMLVFILKIVLIFITLTLILSIVKWAS